MNYKTLIFDLDGTLIDPFIGFFHSLTYALHSFDYPLCTKDEAATYIGPPLEDCLTAVTGSTDPQQIDLLVKKYRERYADLGYQETTIYPGIAELLARLTEEGFLLGVCTSKRVDFAKQILDRHELSSFFCFVDGGDIGIRKNQQLGKLLRDKTLDQRSLMIGDRNVDLIAAHKNNLHSAGVLWGYGSRQELEKESPRFVFETPRDLLTLVSSFRES